MDRAQKQESIETLKGVFADAGAVVVTHNLGLTVAEMTDLRLRLRKEGAALKVVKNTLAQKALDGSIGEAGDALFTGPVAIAYASDPVTADAVDQFFVRHPRHKGKFALALALELDKSLGAVVLPTHIAEMFAWLYDGTEPGSTPADDTN